MTQNTEEEIEMPVVAYRGQKKARLGALTSKTDLNGIIEYANDEFINASGYEDYELIAQPHSIIRHHDMPKVIFKMLWANLQTGNSFQALVKNKTKHGEPYWVMAYFESGKSEKGEITHYFSSSTICTKPINEQIESLYRNLVEVEATGGIEDSEKYLSFFLNVIGKTYVQYIHTI